MSRWLLDLMREESGAALIEYTILLGIMVIAVIGIIWTIGAAINIQWDHLEDALPK